MLGVSQGLANSGPWCFYMADGLITCKFLDSCKNQTKETKKKSMWQTSYVTLKSKIFTLWSFAENLPSPGTNSGETNELKLHCVEKTALNIKN